MSKWQNRIYSISTRTRQVETQKQFWLYINHSCTWSPKTDRDTVFYGRTFLQAVLTARNVGKLVNRPEKLQNLSRQVMSKIKLSQGWVKLWWTFWWNFFDRKKNNYKNIIIVINVLSYKCDVILDISSIVRDCHVTVSEIQRWIQYPNVWNRLIYTSTK